MRPLPTENGVPYFPDGYDGDDLPPRPWPVWVQVAIFIICYIALQAFYAQCGGTRVERFFLENAGSQPAAALIDILRPALHTQAFGTRITASDGVGISISNGCEGTDLYFVLLAAFVAACQPWRMRGVGLALGLILAFSLNQARIIVLFFAYRMDRVLFDLLHTTVAPVFLVTALALYFHAWLRYCPSHEKSVD